MWHITCMSFKQPLYKCMYCCKWKQILYQFLPFFFRLPETMEINMATETEDVTVSRWEQQDDVTPPRSNNLKTNQSASLVLIPLKLSEDCVLRKKTHIYVSRVRIEKSFLELLTTYIVYKVPLVTKTRHSLQYMKSSSMNQRNGVFFKKKKKYYMTIVVSTLSERIHLFNSKMILLSVMKCFPVHLHISVFKFVYIDLQR